MRIILHIAVLLAPFLLSILFGWATMEGYLDLGGGEKDIFATIIPLLLSVVFAVFYIVGICGKLPWSRAALNAAKIAACIMISLGFALFVAGILIERFG